MISEAEPMTPEDGVTFCSYLRSVIERLGAYPPYRSDFAQTARKTLFTEIYNGIACEGRLTVSRDFPIRDMITMAHESILSAKRLREKIPGNAVCVWRIQPETDRGKLYMRLAFEPFDDEQSDKTA